MNAAPVKIRRGQRSDVPEIVSVAGKNPSSPQWPAAEYEQALENIASRRMLLVAESAGQLLGFVVARMVGHEWELENIAVLPERQKKGIGQALMQVLLDVARQQDAEAIYLEVRESNSPARTLYERCGFRASGSRKAYYSGPEEDAVLYRLWCKSGSLKND